MKRILFALSALVLFLLPATLYGNDKSHPASVRVDFGKWSGCGVCTATEDGVSTVLSCKHIFKDTEASVEAPYPLPCTVTSRGRVYAAVAVGGDASCDLAMIVVIGVLPTAKVVETQPAPGTRVWRNGAGTGYSESKVIAADPSWVNESCKFNATAVPGTSPGTTSCVRSTAVRSAVPVVRLVGHLSRALKWW